MITIEPMQASQAPILLDIYRQGILSGMATFETQVPDWTEFDNKFLPHTRIMSKEGPEITGWAALAPVSSRDCYHGVAEVSVYVAQAHQRKGIGRALLLELIAESERNGIWSLLSVIHEENRASIHLHEQCSFRYIGYRERVAQLDGIWRTTVMLERRSQSVGV
ncbi:GNAT family N-acetyltransferase [Paraflavitalea pollutisoli]|uniref:GNAT family N-acetyltransferase n=1 Tax=Paraflavitalea pollutisoli TaxID=3034143 RepID=UPI0023EABD83|nr:GNAT family N-acetyltransferase [Paraflavitalea sp. H1-2-19X]